MPSKSPIMPKLVIIEGKEKGKVIPLNDGKAVLGRSKGDIVIQDPRISRSHVTFQFDAESGRVSFQDMKSLNGTLVNGVVQEKGDLRDGDKIQLGDTQLDIQISEPGRASGEASLGSEPKLLAPPEPDREKEKERSRASKKKTKLAKDRAREEEESTDDSVARELDLDPKSRRASSSLVGKAKERYSQLSPRVRYTIIGALVALGLVIGKGGGHGSSLAEDLVALKTLVSQDKLDEAITLASSLQKKYPQNASLYLTLGDLYSTAHKTALAISTYQKAHELPNTPPMVHIDLAKLYVQSGLTKEVSEELDHIDEIIKKERPGKDFFLEAGQLFLTYRELNEPPEKALILAKALENDIAPDDVAGYKLEAQADFQLKRPDEALAALDKALKLAPEDEWVLENAALAKLATQDVAGATTMLESWLRLKPTATKALLVLAYLKFKANELAQAVPYLQKILQIASTNPNEPHHAEALDLMGKIYTLQKQPNEAVSFFRQACEAGFEQSCDNPVLKSGGNIAAEAQPGTPAPAAEAPATPVPPAPVEPASVPSTAQPPRASAPPSDPRRPSAAPTKRPPPVPPTPAPAASGDPAAERILPTPPPPPPSAAAGQPVGNDAAY